MRSCSEKIYKGRNYVYIYMSNVFKTMSENNVLRTLCGTPKIPVQSYRAFFGPTLTRFGPSCSPEFQALLEALHTCQESLGLFRASVHLQGKRMEDSGCFYKLRPWLLYTHNHSMLFLRLWWLYYYYYYSKMITRTMIFASIGINRINSCQTINATIEITGEWRPTKIFCYLQILNLVSTNPY